MSALGGVMEFQWIGPKAITQGPACTTQGRRDSADINQKNLFIRWYSLFGTTR